MVTFWTYAGESGTTLSYDSKVWHVGRSGKEHFEGKNVQIFVMKCVSEM